MRLRDIAIAILACSLVAGINPAAAEWLDPQQSEFMADCVSSCDRPEISGRRAQCQTICRCVVQDMSSSSTPEDYDAANEAAKSGRSVPQLERIREVSLACVRKYNQ